MESGADLELDLTRGGAFIQRARFDLHVDAIAGKKIGRVWKFQPDFNGARMGTDAPAG